MVDTQCLDWVQREVVSPEGHPHLLSSYCLGPMLSNIIMVKIDNIIRRIGKRHLLHTQMSGNIASGLIEKFQSVSSAICW